MYANMYCILHKSYIIITVMSVFMYVCVHICKYVRLYVCACVGMVYENVPCARIKQTRHKTSQIQCDNSSMILHYWHD